MIRFALLVVCVAACSKSAGNQDKVSSPPSSGGGQDVIAVPKGPAPSMGGATAQPRQGPPPYTSPEVKDGKVTFRLRAAKAEKVGLASSDIPGGGRGSRAMKKGEGGLWEITLDVAPGTYRYRIDVDGVPVVDPRNPAVSESFGNAWSLVRVPGAAFRTKINDRSFFTFGVPRPPFVLIDGSEVLLPVSHRVDNVVTIEKDNLLAAGVAWPESLDRLKGSAYMIAERYGRGYVVTFVDEPHFRLFWRGTLPLFLNTVLYAPSFPHD